MVLCSVLSRFSAIFQRAPVMHNQSHGGRLVDPYKNLRFVPYSPLRVHHDVVHKSNYFDQHEKHYDHDEQHDDEHDAIHENHEHNEHDEQHEQHDEQHEEYSAMQDCKISKISLFGENRLIVDMNVFNEIEFVRRFTPDVNSVDKEGYSNVYSFYSGSNYVPPREDDYIYYIDIKQHNLDLMKYIVGKNGSVFKTIGKRCRCSFIWAHKDSRKIEIRASLRHRLNARQDNIHSMSEEDKHILTIARTLTSIIMASVRIKGKENEIQSIIKPVKATNIVHKEYFVRGMRSCEEVEARNALLLKTNYEVPDTLTLI